MIRALEFHAATVASGDLGPYESIIKIATTNPEVSRQIRGTCLIVFPDHSAAPVVYAVPEVAALLRGLVQKTPYIPYFLVPKAEAGQLNMLLGAHAAPEDIHIDKDQVYVAMTDEAMALLTYWLMATRAFADSVADDSEAVLQALLEPIPAKLSAPMLEFVMAADLAALGLVTTR
jgi:hypothetical protein